MSVILLVEDDVMIVLGLIYALENEKYVVKHAKDIQTARDFLQNIKLDLSE